MNYYILSTLLLLSSICYGQETFQDQFIEEYIQLSTESGKEISKESLEKLASKNKLNESFVINIYAQSFQYDDVAKNNRALMIAYLLKEEKAKDFYHFNTKENKLLESSSAIFMEKWTAFSEGRKVKENEIEIFVSSELERLEKEGINILLIQSIL